MKIKSLFITFLLMLFGVLNSPAAEKKVILTTLSDFAPNCFAKENATGLTTELIPPGKDSVQLQGYSWDVVRESFHIMGYTIELMVAPWSRAMLYIKNKKADLIFPATKTLQREQLYHYSKENVDETKVVVYFNPKSDFQWNGIKSLDGRVIATVRGWSYGKIWEASTAIVKDASSTILQGFKMLDKGRVFGVVGYEDSFDYILKEQHLYQNYQKTPPIDFIADYIIGLNSKKNMNFINDFDLGIQKITQNGMLQHLKKRWEDLITINKKN
jgi:polar amino acid transport system substrate-binding protein